MRVSKEESNQLCEDEDRVRKNFLGEMAFKLRP